MITDLIINVLMGLPYLLLSSLQSLDFNIKFPDDLFEIIKDLSVGVAYVLPITRLMPILIARIGIAIFKICWASVIRVKSFIPTMGA